MAIDPLCGMTVDEASAPRAECYGQTFCVRNPRADGEHIAMAGDGINGAPVLSEAEAGIAEAIGRNRPR